MPGGRAVGHRKAAVTESCKRSCGKLSDGARGGRVGHGGVQNALGSVGPPKRIDAFGVKVDEAFVIRATMSDEPGHGGKSIQGLRMRSEDRGNSTHDPTSPLRNLPSYQIDTPESPGDRAGWLRNASWACS